ncbi:unnamed protein product [Callosobruchus maculatus]|uniref:Uncharacterized protein n=1 Tax=Callosobruchus maculatus TaxID=64391 RepID=A0A653BLZ7_CALMS|nr:unnamed protein product [Callosobruchus maculatus]
MMYECNRGFSCYAFVLFCVWRKQSTFACNITTALESGQPIL